MSNQPVPVDTDGLETFFETTDNTFRWVTPNSAYLSLAERNLATLVSAWRSMDGDGDEAKAFALKLCFINQDLVRLGCLAMDVVGLKGVGKKATYNIDTNPIVTFLDAGGDLAGVAFARNDWPQLYASRMVWKGRGLAKSVLRWSQGLLWSPSDRLDVMSSNELSEQFTSATGKHRRRLFAYLLDSPMPEVAPTGISHLADMLVDGFLALIEPQLNDDRDTIERTRQGARRICHAHLGQAWRDLGMMRRSGGGSRPADIMISGTPKYLGRLLSLFQQERGGQVYRFAHGGERVFFDDAEWAVNELPFCDQYFCHSQGEANAVRQRLQQNRVPRIGADTPTFIGFGSHRHLGIHEGQSKSPAKGGGKNIVYVSNDYTGEAYYMPPAFRCNDVLYTEWQVWLLRTLRDMGFEVTFKAHPRDGSARLAMFSKLCHAVDTAPFEAGRYGSRCLLFDFAGTAFFDALATNIGVVLVDTGTRPLDVTTLADLDRRCHRVLGFTDDRNLFRAEESALREAILGAIESDHCDEGFFEKFFCAAAPAIEPAA